MKCLEVSPRIEDFETIMFHLLSSLDLVVISIGEIFLLLLMKKLNEIQSVSKKRIINLIGRNTTERLDKTGLWKIHSNCYHSQAEVVRSFTYFRMNDSIFRVENWNNFVPFVRMMSTDL
ncbi:hypothetical protein QUC31_001624 [Theobroma cacao]